MSNYTIVTNFVSKDSLASGNPLKLVKGADFTTEFTAVQTAVNTKVDGAAQFFPNGTAAQPSVGFTSNTGVGMYNNAGVLSFAVASALALSISTTGNLTLAAPTASGSYAATITGNATTGGSYGLNIAAGTNGADIGFSVSPQAGGHYTALVRGDGSGTLGYNGTTSTLTFTAAGALTVATPTANASALTVNGIANSAGYAAFAVNAPNTSNNSFGAIVTAGTTSSDYCAFFETAGGTQLLKIYGDGGVVIGSSGTDQGAGTLTIQTGLYLGAVPIYVGAPQTSIAANYTTVLADANKSLFHNSATGHTVTIAANGSVAYPIGTMLTFINYNGGGTLSIAINSDVLTFLPSGAGGTRSLASYGVATAIKVAATTWVISGTNIS